MDRPRCQTVGYTSTGLARRFIAAAANSLIFTCGVIEKCNLADLPNLVRYPRLVPVGSFMGQVGWGAPALPHIAGNISEMRVDHPCKNRSTGVLLAQ